MKSVIILVMDACRYDRINDRVTPNIMKIAQDGVFYEKWFANNSATRLSVPYMLCGEEKYLPPKSIMARLRKHGYMSVIIFSSHAIRKHFPTIGWNHVMDVMGLPGKRAKKLTSWVRGHTPWSIFNIIRKVYRRYQGKESYLPYARAPDTLERVRKVINIFGSKPFFLWVHLMDPHVPYYPVNSTFSHDELVKINDTIMDAVWSRYTPTPEEIRMWEGLYQKEISEMDTAIGEFFRDVDRADKVLILTSDHGDEFGEHGGFSHPENKFIPELLHVPMIKINGTDMGIDRSDRSHRDLPDMVVGEALE